MTAQLVALASHAALAVAVGVGARRARALRVLAVAVAVQVAASLLLLHLSARFDPAPTPYLGAARVAFLAYVVTFCAWPGVSAGAASLLVARRPWWPAVVVCAAFGAALAMAYPELRGEAMAAAQGLSRWLALAFGVESLLRAGIVGPWSAARAIRRHPEVAVGLAVVGCAGAEVLVWGGGAAGRWWVAQVSSVVSDVVVAVAVVAAGWLASRDARRVR